MLTMRYGKLGFRTKRNALNASASTTRRKTLGRLSEHRATWGRRAAVEVAGVARSESLSGDSMELLI